MPLLKDKKQIWDTVLGELEVSMSKANFITWFSNTKVSFIKDGLVEILVPNAFAREWLSNKYHKLICRTLRKSMSDLKQVQYRVEIKKFTPEIDTEIKKPQPKITEIKEQEIEIQDGLSPRYTFETFVVGSSNELAHAASITVARKPGKVYNPLFIYGGVGLGKTHLMQAIANEIFKKYSKKKLKYVTSEKFTNEFIYSISTGKTEDFKRKYRENDVLLIDDIQFLSGKEGTQEEFFHTFNTLYQKDKQIIVSSDKQPKAIPKLEERLVSRFEWGMIADIGLPDFETRLAILRAKRKERNYQIPDEALRYIAQNIQHNIREMEGALNRIIAFAQLKNVEPTVELAQSILANIIKNPKRKRLTTKEIVNEVSGFYDLDKKDLTGKSRRKEYVRPRQIAMFLMREEINVSYPSIGDEIGGRDHTTAMHAVGKIIKEIKENESLEQEINLIKERLYTP